MERWEPQRFEQGKRVQLRRPVGLFTAGTVGIIARAYHKMDSAYDVEFKPGVVWFIFDRYLEPAGDNHRA